jgi:hypothetical protein
MDVTSKPSLRDKLSRALEAASVDVVCGNSSFGGNLHSASAARLADIALSIVRVHEEERASPELTTVFTRCHVEIKVTDATAPFADGYPTEETAAKLAAVAEREFVARQRDEVVDAHICCDDVIADPELSAMAALLPALPLVSRLDRDARERVMDWARHRACDSLPPF